MSSSSSSDSDDYEPMKKIQINIRPKEEVAQRAVADVNLIKASVEAWRPLGPPTHPSLARRQSSLSSVSSMSFGTGSIYGGSANASNMMGSHQISSIAGHPLQSSPSCSSLVNEFNNRSSFSNFISTTSRTSSPLMNQGDTVPIAIAIQESIELVVRGLYDPDASEPKYQTRSLGNIKVAFPNAFARSNLAETSAPLKIRLQSTDNIIQYYASNLMKDLDLDTTSEESPSNKGQTPTSSNGSDTAEQFSFKDAFEADTSQTSPKSSNASKLIQFNRDTLSNQLQAMYDKCPSSRYYNIDILRYQICPISSISEAPLQVCAYWGMQAQLVKLRIDFKHSAESGFNLDRLREVTFTVKLGDLIPEGVNVESLLNGTSNLSNGNNNNVGATNLNTFSQFANSTSKTTPTNVVGPSLGTKHDRMTETNTLVRIPPPPLPQKSIIAPPPATLQRGLLHRNSNSKRATNHIDAFQTQTASTQGSRYTDDLLLGFSSNAINSTNNGFDTLASITQQQQQQKGQQKPYISYKPQAQWNSNSKELIWKFDTLLSYHKNEGTGSLLAKLDFRDCQGIPANFLTSCKPVPVEVKFLVTDSTLSKINLSIESPGYKMSLLKREIRSGRYRSEPYIL